MRLILKKADSSTNLLLFIYKFYRNFAADAKNEIRLPFILELMKAFGKNEAAVRMSLSRSIRSGLFENEKKGNEVYYSPSHFGQQLIDISVKKSNCFLKRYKLRASVWDSKWFCVNLLPREGSDKEKTLKIIEGLKTLGFSAMTEGVWLSPYNMSDEINELMTEFSCYSTVTTYSELTVNMDFSDFLEKVFNLKRYINPYKNFIQAFEGKLNESRKLSNAQGILPKEFSIPLFFEVGYVFFEITFQDPFLPKKILPEWEGDRAAAIALELFDLLSPSLKYYFNLNDRLEDQV